MTRRAGVWLRGIVGPLLLVIGSAGAASGQESVQVAQPALLTFTVSDSGVVTAGNPDGTPVTFTGAVLVPGRALRISVKADGPLVHASGATLDVSRVTWTVSNVVNGMAANGALSASSYAEVLQGTVGATQGGLELRWSLSAGAALPRAGVYQGLLRWKLESITP